MYKSSAQDEILCFRGTTILSSNGPLASSSIKLSTDDNGIERAVLLDVENLVDVIKIISQILVRRVVGLPIPRLPHFGPRELVLRHFRVDPGARVAVPTPGAARVIASFVNDGLESLIPKGFEHKDASCERGLADIEVVDGSVDIPKPAPTTRASTSKPFA